LRVDVRDQTVNAEKIIDSIASAIGKSEVRLQIFDAVHTGKTPVKTAQELAAKLNISLKAALDAGNALVRKGALIQVKKDGRVAYQKDQFAHAHKKQILKRAGKTSPPRIDEHVPVSRRAHGRTAAHIHGRAITIHIDDVDSFSMVKGQPPGRPDCSLPEESIRLGFQAILGEFGTFKDWPGEQYDLFTTRVRLNGRRVAAAIALKGPARKKKKLTLSDYGKNADQLIRLFDAPATLYVVQGWTQIDSTVLKELEVHAREKARSTGKDIYVCLIDGSDTNRIVDAYRTAFGE
jgi:hypothetical protein